MFYMFKAHKVNTLLALLSSPIYIKIIHNHINLAPSRKCSRMRISPAHGVTVHTGSRNEETRIVTNGVFNGKQMEEIQEHGEGHQHS